MNELQIPNYYENIENIIEEKINGKIYLMARPERNHLRVQRNIMNIFENYFKTKGKKCEAIIEDELYIDDNNYLVPDVEVLCHDKSDDIPVIVIEVLSKSTRDKDLTVKMKKYAEIGIKEYWIIDYKNRSVDIYILSDKIDKIYEAFKSYSLFLIEDFSRIKKDRERQEKEAIKEFFPVSFPEINIPLEDVFYMVDS